MSPRAPVPELTPALAATGAVAAGFMHQLLAWLLMESVGAKPAAYALGGLFAYGAFFALLAPRLGEPAAVRLGFVRAPLASALACVLLLGSVLLISEVDNLVRRVFPLPEAIREALDPPSAPGGMAPGIELALVEIAVLPLIYELFYRGLVQPVLARRLGAARGVLLTAALEASAPFANLLFLWAWPVVAARGALLGMLRQCSGSLWPALALRAAMGAVQTAAHYDLFGIPGFDVRGAAHTPPEWLAAAALPTALGLWLCRRLSRSNPT
jgi:membrane protease YdiL (CAAX protease family)